MGCRAKAHLGQVWHGVEAEGAEDGEQRLDHRLVVADHGRVAQRADERVDGDRRVVLLAAGHQAGRRQQLVAPIAVKACSTDIE